MDNHTPADTTAANTIGDLIEPVDHRDVGYTSRVFVQALFPYRSSTDLIRQVQQGPTKITVTATAGLPYGKYPRLVMAYVITKAVEREGQVKTGSMSVEEARRIPLGNSLNAFLRAIGLTTRGSGTVIARIRDQVDRIAACSIRVENVAQTALSTRRAANPTVDISNYHELWLSPDPDQPAMSESFIELTEEFYDEINRAPIPIDISVLQQLGKPRAMDIYTWLALKKFWLSKRNERSFTFTWETLEGHFSPVELTTWVQRRDFRTEIKKCVASIAELWPEVGAEVTAEGLLVHQGPTPIPPKPRRKLESR